MSFQDNLYKMSCVYELVKKIDQLSYMYLVIQRTGESSFHFLVNKILFWSMVLQTVFNLNIFTLFTKYLDFFLDNTCELYQQLLN